MKKPVLASCVGALLLTLAGYAGGREATGTALVAGGAVERPAELSAADIRQRPAVTQTRNYVSGSDDSTKTHTYTGTSTWALLQGLGFTTDPVKKGDLLNRYLLATGSDGYSVVFSSGEMNPAFGNMQSVVAYDETRSGATVPLGADGSLLLTAPGDRRGSRYVSNLVRLEWRAPPAAAATGAIGGASSGVAIYGAVAKPMRFDVAALKALPATTQTLGDASYTGVSLWTLLDRVTGIDSRNSAQQKHPMLRMAAVATGSDGYSVLLALGEIDPTFGGRGALLAYSIDGQPLDRSGPIRLVVAGDLRTGRSVSDLQSIRVFSIDEGDVAAR